MKNNLDVKYLLLITLVALLTISIWFRHGHQLGTAEGGLPFNNLQRHAEIFRYTWADTNLGNSTGYLVAAYPTYKLLSFLEKINIPAYLIEATVFWLILTSAGFGIYGIGKKIVNLSENFTLVAVFFYWLSPFVLVNIWSRFLYNHIFFFALLPVGLFFFLQGLIKRKFSYLFFTLLAIIIFSYSLTALALTILILTIFLVVTGYFFIIENDTKSRVFYIKYLVVFFFLYILTNFWWISQFFSFGNSNNFSQSITSFFTTDGNVNGLTQISSKLGSFIDLARFIHYSFFYENATFWTAAFINMPAFFLNTVFLMLILFGIYFSRKNKIMILFALLFICSLFFAKGNNPPLGEIYTYFFVKSSLLQTFRNPVEKISLITVLSGALLFAYSLENLQRKFLNNTIRKTYLPIAAILIMVFFWGWPFFSGFLFTNYQNSLGQTFNYETQVPDYYKDANYYIKNNPEISRVLVLPLLGEGITYNWRIPYTGIDLYSTLFDKQNVALNTTIPFYYDIVGNVVNYQSSNSLLSFLPLLATDGILLREDVDTVSRSFPDASTTKQFLSELQKKGIISLNKIFGPLTLYTVSKPYSWGKFYLTNQIIVTNEKDYSLITKPTNNVKLAYIDPSVKMDNDLVPKQVVITPSQVNHYERLEKYEKQTTADLYSQLLYVKHSPDDLLYPFVRSKEFLTSFLYTDYPKWVLFNTNLLGKRAVEICQYDPVRSSKTTREILIEDYQNEYGDLIKHVRTIVDEKRALKDDILNSLAAQAVLLSRCQQIPFSFYNETFISVGLIPSVTNNEINYSNQIELIYQIPENGWYFKKIVLSDPNQESEFLQKGTKQIVYSQDQAYIQNTLVDLKNIDIDMGLVLQQPLTFDDYNSSYEIKLDYQTQNGDFLGMYIKQDFDLPNSPVFFQGIPLSDKRQTYSVTITPSKGAKNANIGFTGNKNMFCLQKCILASNQLKAKIYRIQIIKKDLKRPFFVLENQVSPVSSQITGIRLSPVKYKVHINKTTPGSEVLVFSELFSNDWSLSQSANKHFLVNGFANGWIINQTGEYDLEMEYATEKKLIASYMMSFVAIIFVILATIFNLKSGYFKK